MAKRKAKLFSADGKELHAGDTVWLDARGLPTRAVCDLGHGPFIAGAPYSECYSSREAARRMRIMGLEQFIRNCSAELAELRAEEASP